MTEGVRTLLNFTVTIQHCFEPIFEMHAIFKISQKFGNLFGENYCWVWVTDVDLAK